jgi:hypothetical protein
LGGPTVEKIIFHFSFSIGSRDAKKRRVTKAQSRKVKTKQLREPFNDLRSIGAGFV